MAQSQDANLKTTEWGVAGVPRTALLVHGITGRAASFEVLAEKLNPVAGIPGGPWRFIAPDLRGRGASRELAGGEGGIPEHARDLLALLNREGLERVVFVGHSLGAMIGVYLAAEHPERFLGLVLVDGGANVTEDVDELIKPAVERLQRSYPSRKAYLEHVKSFPAFEGRWDEHIERYYAGDVYRGEDDAWHPVADPEAVKRDREKIPGFPLDERHAQIRCPTLILLSTVGLLNPDKGFILPPDDARRMEKSIPSCTLVRIDDANHYDILYSAPPATVDAVRVFLSRLGG